MQSVVNSLITREPNWSHDSSSPAPERIQIAGRRLMENSRSTAISDRTHIWGLDPEQQGKLETETKPPPAGSVYGATENR